MVILGIESTCDETGVAIVANGREILASVVASSVEFHKKYHGVVPEVAAREQIRCILPVIAEKYGAEQDFLFPGVTPSDKNTLELDEYVYHSLSGKPVTSVRNITGVGGLRYDKDWNYATDFSTFVDLKVKEDKRYYPGIGLYYALMNTVVKHNENFN